jgi:hypothetical protein
MTAAAAPPVVATIDDLHLAEDPDARLAAAADGASRLIVRVPDRQTDGIRCLGVEDVATLLRAHGRIVEVGVTPAGTICGAIDVVRRRGKVAVWTGPAIGPWHPSDVFQRGLGGSETAAVRISDHLADMRYLVTLYGDFQDKAGLVADVLCRRYQEFDPSKHLDVLVGFRNATLFDRRPNADFTCLWLEDLAPAEGLTPGRAANIDKICAVSNWHAAQVRRVHPWLEESHVVACRNGIHLPYFRDED